MSFRSVSLEEKLVDKLKEYSEFINGLIEKDTKVDQIVQNTIKLDGVIKYLIEMSRFLDRSTNGQFQALTRDDFQAHRLKGDMPTTASEGYRRIES